MKITRETKSEFSMQITKMTKTHADRQARYRERKGDELRASNAARMRKVRAAAIPEFIGVDSEGTGHGKDHRTVLLGVGEEQYIARDQSIGLQWDEVFEFLYGQFRKHPQAAFVGFYLSYDFNRWLNSLPKDKAWLLLSPRGRKLRHRKLNQKNNKLRNMYWPVRVDGWEIDMMGFKRLSIRPWCGHAPEMRCGCDPEPWMHICDAGPFFQMGFKNVLEPFRWKDDPDGPVCTQEEWDTIFVGKENRADAVLDEEMMRYNRLENVLLARVMERLAKGFLKVGVKLAKDQWYGPGASASKWLTTKGTIKQRELMKFMPEWFIDACCKSYFGGWFEIFSHGLILGSSWNYDINNAYPYASSKLPHICGECRYTRGQGDPKGDGDYVLVYASVFTKGKRIGAVPHRDKAGSILRPSISKGWYWLFEIRAAERAGLVKKVYYTEWVEFLPCSHGKPFTDIQFLYNERLRVGKDSAQGMAIKLNNNSIYGKFAQSAGSAPYNNWFYASYITAHCRTQILDAIATHPRGSESVLMVATDGICFDSPHPHLPISKKLGEWAASEYTDLALFKPGVYWHREGKEALLKVKSRGVPKKEFMLAIDNTEHVFRTWLATQYRGTIESIIEGPQYKVLIGEDTYEAWQLWGETGWPYFYVPIRFRMKSCRQALNEGKWEDAGNVMEETWIRQDSDPQSKRRNPTYNAGKNRIDTEIHDLPYGKTETTYYADVKFPGGDIGFGYEGSAIDVVLEAATILRDKPANYDLPFQKGYEVGDNVEWVTIWDGGNAES